VKLTADTITDEQIRELRSMVLHDATPFEAASDREASRILNTCDVALYGLKPDKRNARHVARARARCAEILNARAAIDPVCDFHDAHDAVTYMPTGNRCRALATHRIEWADGRHSFGCAAHLTIDEAATVKPTRFVSLNARVDGK
jgi:hypothetical protein